MLRGLLFGKTLAIVLLCGAKTCWTAGVQEQHTSPSVHGPKAGEKHDPSESQRHTNEKKPAPHRQQSKALGPVLGRGQKHVLDSSSGEEESQGPTDSFEFGRKKGAHSRNIVS